MATITSKSTRCTAGRDFIFQADAPGTSACGHPGSRVLVVSSAYGADPGIEEVYCPHHIELARKTGYRVVTL
jgi:hypothetical protein